MRLNTKFTEAISLMSPDGDTAISAGEIAWDGAVWLLFNDGIFLGHLPAEAPAGTVVRVEYEQLSSGGNSSYYGYYGIESSGDFQIFADEYCKDYPSGEAQESVYVRINNAPSTSETTYYTDGVNSRVAGCVPLDGGQFELSWNPRSGLNYAEIYREISEGCVYQLQLDSGSGQSLQGLTFILEEE